MGEQGVHRPQAHIHAWVRPRAIGPCPPMEKATAFSGLRRTTPLPKPEV